MKVYCRYCHTECRVFHTKAVRICSLCSDNYTRRARYSAARDRINSVNQPPNLCNTNLPKNPLITLDNIQTSIKNTKASIEELRKEADEYAAYLESKILNRKNNVVSPKITCGRCKTSIPLEEFMIHDCSH